MLAEDLQLFETYMNTEDEDNKFISQLLCLFLYSDFPLLEFSVSLFTLHIYEIGFQNVVLNFYRKLNLNSQSRVPFL